MTTTVLGIHGGGWVSGYPAEMDPVLNPLYAAGYAGGSMTYTLNDIPQAVSDIRAGINFWKNFGPVVLYGISAGAHLAACLAARGECDGAVVALGPSDLNAIPSPSIWPYYFSQQHWIDTKVSTVALRDQFSPVDRVTNPCPCYVLHGTSDPLVPHIEGVNFYNAIKNKPSAAGSKWTSMSGVGHELPQSWWPVVQQWIQNRWTP